MTSWNFRWGDHKLLPELPWLPLGGLACTACLNGAPARCGHASKDWS